MKVLLSLKLGFLTVTLLGPPQSLYYISYNGKDTFPSTAYGFVVQWENEVFSQQIAIDHFQETRVSAEDEMITRRVLAVLEVVEEELDRGNYNMAGQCMTEYV